MARINGRALNPEDNVFQELVTSLTRSAMSCTTIRGNETVLSLPPNVPLAASFAVLLSWQG